MNSKENNYWVEYKCPGCGQVKTVSKFNFYIADPNYDKLCKTCSNIRFSPLKGEKEDYYTTSETAQRTNLKKKRIQRYCRENKIASVKTNTSHPRYYIHRKEIEKLKGTA